MIHRPLSILPASLVLIAIGIGCGSSDDDGVELASPGDACDGSKPITCGGLARGSAQRDVVLVCKSGRYESVMDCKPTNSGQTNRCFAGASSTIVDCFDEPTLGSVTRCEVSGAGTSTSHSCTVSKR